MRVDRKIVCKWNKLLLSSQVTTLMQEDLSHFKNYISIFHKALLANLKNFHSRLTELIYVEHLL